jgi:hypothetical protein
MPTWRRWIPTGKRVGEWCSTGSNLATVAVALLAFWAYFFTSLPDDLARQFRTEISDLNEQLVDLRRERRNLDDDVRSARADVTQLTRDRLDLLESMERTRSEQEERIAAVNADLASSQAALAAGRSELQRLEQSRTSLIREIVAFKLEGAVADATTKLKSMRSDARMAASLIAYKDWRAQGKDVGEPDRSSSESMQAWSLRFDRWHDRMPSAWRMAEMFSSGFVRDYEGEKVNDVAAHFRKELAETKPAVSGESLIRDAMEALETSALSPHDRKRLNGFVKEYMSARSAVFTATVSIAVPLSTPEQVVVDIGNRTTKQIDALDEALKRMPAVIAGRFAN